MTTPMEVLLRTILVTYFSNSRCIIVIADGPLLVRTKIPIPLMLLSPDTIEDIPPHPGCQDFVLYTTRPRTVFDRVEAEILRNHGRFNRRKYIVLSMDENQLESPLEVASSTALNYVSDLLAIVPEESLETYTLWTHEYVGRVTNNRMYLLDKWYGRNGSFLHQNNLFPDKLSEQQGRDLKAALVFFPPYVVFEPRDDNRSSYFYMGSEMMLMVTIAQYLNMTLVPVVDDNHYWGDVWKNGSGNGLIGNVAMDNADIGGCALYRWELPFEFMDYSKTTVRAGVTCIVPVPKLAAAWLTPFFAFASDTWIGVAITFLACFLTLLGIAILVENNDTQQCIPRRLAIVWSSVIISVSKTFMLQSVTDTEMGVIRGSLGRYFMGLVFVTTLVLDVAYDSGLATIMTIPRYEDPINTREELIASGLTWGATEVAYIFSLEQATDPVEVAIKSRFRAFPEAKLREISRRGSFAFAIERLLTGDFAIPNHIHADVIDGYRVMSEDLYWDTCLFMLRKSSILMPYVDRVILRAVQTGLVVHWQNEAALKYMNQYLQRSIRNNRAYQTDGGVVTLKMIHVEGVFGILIFGHLAALLAFCAEKLHHKFTHNNSRKKCQ